MTNIARNGAPKKPTPITPHSGMRSRVEARDVTTPKIGKRGLKPVAPHPAVDPFRPDRGKHCDITREMFEAEAASMAVSKHK